MPKKKQDNTLQEIDNENMELDAHRVRFQNIALTHGLVSKMKTPKAYIKDKMGMDYVEIGYMIDIILAGVGRLLIQNLLEQKHL